MLRKRVVNGTQVFALLENISQKPFERTSMRNGYGRKRLDHAVYTHRSVFDFT